MGKVFHPGPPNGQDDSKYSWSPEGLPYYHCESLISDTRIFINIVYTCLAPVETEYGPGNKTSELIAISLIDILGYYRSLVYAGLWWAFDGFEDNQLPDGQICDNALKVLQELRMNKTKGDDRPFFLAVGFHKPVSLSCAMKTTCTLLLLSVGTFSIFLSMLLRNTLICIPLWIRYCSQKTLTFPVECPMLPTRRGEYFNCLTIQICTLRARTALIHLKKRTPKNVSSRIWLLVNFGARITQP